MKRIESFGSKDTRSGFGAGLMRLGEEEPRVVALCADLQGSLKMDAFIGAHPERYVECGIAEANMIGVAAGLANDGFIPFAGTFAAFATGRVYDQIRQSVAYSCKNVKIAASHAGITLGEDGATHQILEDIGLMRMLPNMAVVVPCDYNQTLQATLAVARHQGPVYLRFGRPSVPVFTPADEPFELGKAQRLLTGEDVTLFACGHMVWEALEAAYALGEEGISAEVINLHTIKPLDESAVVESASRTGAVVTCEEHMRFGGMGEAVSGVLARHCPTVQEWVAVEDTFGESGKPRLLMERYGLTARHITEVARRVVARKKR